MGGHRQVVRDSINSQKPNEVFPIIKSEELERPLRGEETCATFGAYSLSGGGGGERTTDSIDVFIPAPMTGLQLYGSPAAPLSFPDAHEMPLDVRVRLRFPRKTGPPVPVFGTVSAYIPPPGFPTLYRRVPFVNYEYIRPTELCQHSIFPHNLLVIRHPDPKRVVTFNHNGAPMASNSLEITPEIWNPHYIVWPTRTLSEPIGLSWYYHIPTSTAYLTITHCDVLLAPGMSLHCDIRMGDIMLTEFVSELDGLLLFQAVQRTSYSSNAYERYRWICIHRDLVYPLVHLDGSAWTPKDGLDLLRSRWYRILEGYESRQLDKSSADCGFPPEQYPGFI